MNPEDACFYELRQRAPPMDKKSWGFDQDIILHLYSNTQVKLCVVMHCYKIGWTILGMQTAKSMFCDLESFYEGKEKTCSGQYLVINKSEKGHCMWSYISLETFFGHADEST